MNHDQVLATNDMGLDLLRQLGTAAFQAQPLYLARERGSGPGHGGQRCVGETRAKLLRAMRLEGWSEEATNRPWRVDSRPDER